MDYLYCISCFHSNNKQTLNPSDWFVICMQLFVTVREDCFEGVTQAGRSDEVVNSLKIPHVFPHLFSPCLHRHRNGGSVMSVHVCFYCNNVRLKVYSLSFRLVGEPDA